MSRAEPGRQSWLLCLIVALVIGIGAGAVAVGWLHHVRDTAIAAQQVEEPLAERPNDRLDSTLAELAVDGVSVSDDGRYLLGRSGEAVVERAVGASPVSVFVVVWAEQQQLGGYEGDVIELLAARLAELPGIERGVLFVWQGPETGFVVTVGADGYLSGSMSALDFVGDPAITLPKAIAATSDLEWYDDERDGNDYWGGVSGGVLLGTLIALGIVVVLLGGALLVRLAGGPRLPGRWGIGTEPATTDRPRKKKR